MERIKQRLIESSPIAFISTIMAVVIALVDIYADHMGLVAAVERLESSVVHADQRAVDVERRLDQCSERVSRLQAFIEFRK